MGIAGHLWRLAPYYFVGRDDAQEVFEIQMGLEPVCALGSLFWNGSLCCFLPMHRRISNIKSDWVRDEQQKNSKKGTKNAIDTTVFYFTYQAIHQSKLKA